MHVFAVTNQSHRPPIWVPHWNSLFRTSHFHSVPMAKILHEDLFLWKCQAPANLHMTGNLLMGIACRNAQSVNMAIAHLHFSGVSISETT